MALFPHFPWTNFHELNLDWLINKVKEISEQIPEGLIGIPKGGTGASTPAGARENLEIYAVNIKTAADDPETVDARLVQLNNDLLSLAGDLQYTLYKSVTKLGLTAGTATLGAAWTAMSNGNILIAQPSDFVPAEMPETSGALVMIRNGGTSGSIRFYGSRTYEMAFAANYPSGTWHTLVNDNDVIPISKGGTGATTAEEAISNLGIDFSGTVLSVAGIGADPNGNVPLKISNLVPVDISSFGIPSGSTVQAVYTVMPDHSAVVLPASQIGNAPNNNGIIAIMKDSTNNLASIEFHGKNLSAGDFKMYLNSSNAPSGTWVRINDPAPFLLVSEDAAVDNFSVPAGGMATTDWTFPVQSGYTPIMAYNVTLSNATTSGSGAGNCGIMIYRIGNLTSGPDNSVRFRVFNSGNSTAKVKIGCRMLYFRTPPTI